MTARCARNLPAAKRRVFALFLARERERELSHFGIMERKRANECGCVVLSLSVMELIVAEKSVERKRGREIGEGGCAEVDG